MKLKANPVRFVLEHGQPIAKVMILQSLELTSCPAYSEAVNQIKTSQNRDGGFHLWNEPGPSRGRLTSLVLEYVGEKEKGKVWIKQAASWLFSLQCADGGFSENQEVALPPDHPLVRKGQGCLLPTSDAIAALTKVGLRTDPRCTKAIAFLRSLQNPDGSWCYWKRPNESAQCSIDIDYPLRALDAFGDRHNRVLIERSIAFIKSLGDWDWFAATCYLPCFLIAKAHGLCGLNEDIDQCLHLIEEAQNEDGSWPYPYSRFKEQDPWLTAYIIEWLVRADSSLKLELRREMKKR